MSAKVFQIPFLQATPSLKLHSIVQRTPKPNDSAPKDYPDIKHFTSLEPFLADAALDVVILSSPPQTHFAFTKAVLEAGKHVFVEKPFVPTSAEADELATLAKQKGLVLCVYQNRRWDSDFLTVRKLLAEGTLGRILEFETHFDRNSPNKAATWKGSLTMKDGGGVIYDLGTHLIDQVYTLFGMPETVYAKFANQREGKIGGEADIDPDSATVQLAYPNGMLALVRMACISQEKRQFRYWVRGTKGSYHKNGLDTQEPQLRHQGMSVDDPKFGHEDPEWDGRLEVPGPDGKTVDEKPYPNVEPVTYKKIYELFAHALATGKEEDNPVPATQARDVLKIIEAAKESGRTGSEVRL